MHKLFFIAVLLIGSSFSVPVMSSNYIKIVVSGITEDGGNIRVGIFKSQNGFPVSGKQYKGFEYPVKNKKVNIYIPNIPKGNYAIGILHDVNKNGKMDKNFIGYPTEAYGFSNNARATFSAPTYEEAKFYHDGTTTLNIDIY